jgi:integrase
VDGDTSDFDDAIAAEGLHEYACRYSVSNLVELQRHFGLVYYACIMLFYAFTGMRRSEAYSLNLKSLKRKFQDGRVIAYGLAGFTTKFRKSRVRVVWYTSQDVVAPFEAASHICETIMDCNGCRTDHQYLFLTTTYFPFAIGRKGRALDSSAPTLGNYEPYKYQRFIGDPIIDSSHIRELQTFNPFRQWESEDKFLVGKPWPLKIHQFRRSTAVYAIASGLVSLPALKSMLKHLTVAMSRYYAKGSIYAHNILKRSEGDKDAWVVRYQESEVFVRAFQYVNELIVPDEVLYGPAGVWLERNAKPGLKKILYADSLENTLIKMQKGQLSYRSTPVGGCTFNGECDKRISVDFVGCDGCSYSAVKLSKVSKLIATQEVFVSNIIGQAEQQFEKNTLDELKDFARRMGARDVDVRVN